LFKGQLFFRLDLLAVAVQPICGRVVVLLALASF
jgi:hypothetical protein